MNKVLLTGRLTRDAETKQSEAEDRSRLCFTLAVKREYKSSNGENDADFVPVVMWTKFPDKFRPFLIKGKSVSVTGRINVSSYDNGNGQKKYFTQVVAENIEFLESKKDVV